uniref:Uncharacterized protein n=1 Tax=Caenorhabditis japonica TaxID=281687 RepID=A0A8R1I7X9_CAEJA
MAETSKLDEMFKDRYTGNDERYKKMAEEGFEKVVVIHPWNSSRDNYNRDNHRGGFGGGCGRGNGNYRGNWNPRGRGGYYGDRRDGQSWRGGGGGGGDGGHKRHFN